MRKAARSVLALAAAGIVIGTIVAGHTRCADVLARLFDSPQSPFSSPSLPTPIYRTSEAALRQNSPVPVTAVLLADVKPSRPDASAHRFFLQKDGGLWESVHGRQMQVSGANFVEKITAAQGNVYAFKDEAARHWALVICGADGTLIKRIILASKEADRGNAIMSLSELRSGLLYMYMHVNPDLGVGVTINPRTGQWRGILACNFFWNPSGTHLVCVVDPPYFTARDAAAVSSIYLDGVLIRHVAPGSVGAITWNDESNFIIQAETTLGERRTFKGRCDDDHATMPRGVQLSAAR